MLINYLKQQFQNSTIVKINNNNNTIRVVFCNFKNTEKYCDLMVLNSLTLEDLSENDGILVVVGANPALCDELLIDRTNSNLISILKNKNNKHKTYKAYCLINLYNEIAGSFCDFYNTNPNHPNSNETTIVNFLKKFANSDLLIMWGSTFKKSYKPKNSGQLYAWVNSTQNRVFISANANNDFCHGSVASQIINYSTNIKNIW